MFGLRQPRCVALEYMGDPYMTAPGTDYGPPYPPAAPVYDDIMDAPGYYNPWNVNPKTGHPDLTDPMGKPLKPGDPGYHVWVP
mmetsp:Transcript_2058/g.3288  ORF Transcript_2058/g.3288 Transcript_2058/m.3288 type:complete len:83 (-) Transcript_2058:78-326(-)